MNLHTHYCGFMHYLAVYISRPILILIEISKQICFQISISFRIVLEARSHIIFSLGDKKLPKLHY